LQYQEPVTWTYSGSSWAATDLITRVPTGSNPQNATGEATVLAVNSGGVAVGNDNLSNFPSTSWYACVFQGGNAVTLGSFPNTQSELDSATGINDSGVVVGYAEYGSSGTHAFIWDSVHGFRDMNTVFGPTGYNIIPTGWTLYSAASIDDNGDIAGEAVTSGGEYLGFVITAPAVPEPSTLLLAAAGLVGLLTYAWRKRKQP
jgi:probable HAF family extracellular repeat protein